MLIRLDDPHSFEHCKSTLDSSAYAVCMVQLTERSDESENDVQVNYYQTW